MGVKPPHERRIKIPTGGRVARKRNIVEAVSRRAKRKIGIFFQKIRNVFFVFLGRVGAGGIEKIAAGADAVFDVRQNVPLARGAERDVFFAPHLDGVLTFAKHSLARAGRVAQNDRKSLGKAFFEKFRVGIQAQDVSESEPLDVADQCFAAVRNDLV